MEEDCAFGDRANGGDSETTVGGEAVRGDGGVEGYAVGG